VRQKEKKGPTVCDGVITRPLPSTRALPWAPSAQHDVEAVGDRPFRLVSLQSTDEIMVAREVAGAVL
jgi:hypothetical protein